MANIEGNEGGFKELRENLNQLFDDITVLSEGSEEDAIADVKRQLMAKGVEPTDEGVAQHVRQVRQG